MSADASPIPLPERFTSGELATLRRTVDGRRADGAPVTFDARAVRAVDSAALQFLLVCRATQTAAGGEPVLVAPSETLTAALREIGATEPLDR